jgi:hypothetical protein
LQLRPCKAQTTPPMADDPPTRHIALFSRYSEAPQALLCGQVPRYQSVSSATISTGSRLPQFTMGSGEAPFCTIHGRTSMHLIWSPRISRIESIKVVLPASFSAQLIFNPLLLKPSHWPFFWITSCLCTAFVDQCAHFKITGWLKRTLSRY